MKKVSILVLVTLLLLATISPVIAAGELPSLQLAFVNQDPDPASVGGYVTIKLRLDNVGDGTARTVQTRFIESYPFSLDPSETVVKSIGDLGPRQSGTAGTIIEYKVRVASDAVEGENKIKVEYEYSNSQTLTFEFDIEVKTQDSGLSIDSVAIENEYLEPGQKGLVELFVLNPSDSTLRDVSISLDLSDADLPLAPSDGATTKKINFLKSNAQGIFRFGLIPFADAASKVYKIPVDISYYDSTNTLVKKSETIGVVIGSTPDIRMFTETESFTSEMNKGEVSVTFVNKGLIDVKFLHFVAKDTEDYSIVSSKEVYVGEVESDDFENADFTIVRKNSKETFDVVFDVTYKDANNNAFEEELSVPVTLFGSSKKKSPLGIVFLVLVVLVIGWFVYKKVKKGKKRN